MKAGTYKKHTSPYAGYPPLILQLRPVFDWSDDQLFKFSQINRDLQIERNELGELIIMPPTGGETGEQNAEITMQLRLWAKEDGIGATFDSSSGFRLPNGAVRSPDASWIKQVRLDSLTKEQRKKFIPLCPDFVIELCSSSDSLPALQEKMQEYIDNGAELGWLIAPIQKLVYVYSNHEPVKKLNNPQKLSGDPFISGFVLDLQEILVK